MRCFIFLTFLVACSVACRIAHAQDLEFNRDIRPILSDKCFYCHGNDEKHREADLRLDTFEDATDYAIVPGEPSESEVLRRILSDDPDEIMPPPDSEKSLSKKEKELVERWIEQGATYQQHWAWSPLHRPEVTDEKGTTLKGPAAVDALLATGWKENDAAPVDLATPREKLRRLSFDLRGLMPTPREVSEFETDPSEETFSAFRDRWMSELSYAEHQAVRWLDLVRWADTSGFVSDEPIASGAYRAWIIDSFRKNQPFDQFSTEQLAGDLLPDPTDDQLIASGYNRIVNTNCEAGAIEAEQLYKLKGEHVRAVGTVWMGLTTGCAECHDHKFDPISAKDYYSLAAFFDDLIEAGVYTPGDRREPLHYVHEDQAASESDRQLQSEIAELKTQIQSEFEKLKPAKRDKLEADVMIRLKDKKSRTDFVWIGGRPMAARATDGNYLQTKMDDKPVRETRAQSGQLQRHFLSELMSGYIFLGSYATDKKKDEWFVDVWIDEDQRPEMIGVQIACGDYGRTGWRSENYETYFWGADTSGELAKSHDWNSPDRVRRLGDLPKESGWVRLRIPEGKLLKPHDSQKFEKTGMAWLHVGGRVLWGDSGLTVRADKAQRFQLMESTIRKWWEQPYNRQSFEFRHKVTAEAFLKPDEKRDELQNELVTGAIRELSQPKLVQQLREKEAQLFRHRTSAMPVLVSRQTKTPKTTRVLNRGDYQDKTGDLVTAAVPDFLLTDDAPGEGATRLDLANWLFGPASHLIARVHVNRLWHQYFGRGISETLEDSGTQGDWPSHLELLNWLACEFRESGWDRNHMVRLLTSTRAYQLSSTPTSDLAQRDPSNRWHARQGRFRLPAESIRDISLQAAGLLKMTDQVPTRSFFPYQPSVYWTRSDKIMYGSRHMQWETSTDQQQYQRTLYSFWKRQNIHPTMLAFDAPTRQECTAKRNVTNTPGQALASLNDPIFVEAGRVLATRVCEQAETDRQQVSAQQLDWLFQVTLQRSPIPAESAVLLGLLDTQRHYYLEHPDDASKLLAIGQKESPKDQMPEVAAWTAVTRSVLNLHEFLNRQ